MAVARVGSPATGTASASPASPTFPQTPTSGNLLTLAVTIYRASNNPSCSTPTGWTAGPTLITTNGTARVGIFTFYKIAASSESSPSFTFLGTPAWVLEEWSGVDQTTPVSASGTPAGNTASSGTVTDGGVSATSGDFIWSTCGSRTSGTQPTYTWGGGSTVDQAVYWPASNNVAIGTGTQTAASTGTVQPSVTYSTGQATNIASIAFKPAGSSTKTGTATVSLGALTVAATSLHTGFGVTSQSLGALTISATGVRSGAGIGTVTAALGALTVAATGQRTTYGVASVPLGGLTVTATGGGGTQTGTATVTLGPLTVAALGIGPYHREVLADRPVAYYRLDETSGTTAADSSGNGVNGTYTQYAGGPNFTLGANGLLTTSTDKALQCLGQNGFSNRLVLGDGILIPGNASIEAWVRVDAPTDDYLGRQWIVGSSVQAGGYTVAFALEWIDGDLVFEVGSPIFGGQYARFPAALATRYHVVGTWDGSRYRFYVNGRLVGTVKRTAGGGIVDWTEPFSTGVWSIGTRYVLNDGVVALNGVVDEVALYNTALPADRIHTHYLAGGPTAEAVIDLGGLTVTATGLRTVNGAATTDLGGLTIAASDGTITGRATVTLGGLTVTAAGDTLVRAAATVNLGNLDVDAVAVGDLARSTAFLYRGDGKTCLGPLPLARGIKYQMQLSAVGSGSFEVPEGDTMTALCTDNRIVKFFKHGKCQAAIVLKSSTIQRAVDGTVWRRFDNQPDINALLAEAVVAPEYGFGRTSPSTRLFGFMSKAGPWMGDGHWIYPSFLLWSFDRDVLKGHRKGQPYGSGFSKTDPYWIGLTDPYAPVPAGTNNYVRRQFTIKRPYDVRIVCTADDYPTLYVDGEQVIVSNGTSAHGWQQYYEATLRLQAGTHTIAGKAHASYVPGPPPDLNPVSFILSMQQVDDNGNVGDTLLVSDTTWTVYDNTSEPGWSRAVVFKILIEEAQDRGVRGPSFLRVGWTTSDDSHGNAWTDVGEYEFDVATINLADVGTQLAESEFDWWTDPRSMTVQAWRRKGIDRSATVALALGKDGGNLKSYETNRVSPKFTRVYTQLSDGSFVTTSSDPNGVGLIESGLSTGSTNSARTAQRVASAQLDESANDQTSATALPSALDGPQALVDYFLGDTITVPNHDGTGTMKARVSSITVDESGEVPQVWPEFAEDLS